VRGKTLTTTTLLGVPLVLGRDERRKAYALRDVCPHRGIPLSFGRFDGQALECSYHGWRFDPYSGQCREVPSLAGEAKEKLRVERIFAGCFPCEEQDGYIWVWMGDPEGRQGTKRVAGDAPQLPKFGDRYRMVHLAAEIPVNVDQGIIGLMDPAHGPFVHQAWWWRSRRSIHEKQKAFEPIPLGFRMSPHSPSSNSAPYKMLRALYGAPVTTTIDFVLPNMRFEQIRCGRAWFSSRATVTPIEARRSRLDFCAAWDVFPWNAIVGLFIGVFGPRFIEQDAETMRKQAIGLRFNPNLMLIDDADRPAKWYFQLKAAYLESQRTGAPMVHSLTGPITLRWRS